MKIGFSFGRCVGSIVRDEVKIEDVLCIIARTNMIDESGVGIVVNTYMDARGYLAGLDEAKCQEVGLELWRSGKVIEPRTNGVRVIQVPTEYIWMDLYPTALEVNSDAVKDAWDAYRMLIMLAEQVPEMQGDDPQLAGTMNHSRRAREVPKNQAFDDTIPRNISNYDF